MVPTSDSARGESTFPITSVLPVELPGFKADDPLSTDTSTSFPANVAAPTSTFLSVGSPMRISFPDFGMKRTRPICGSLADVYLFSHYLYSRPNDGIDMLLEYTADLELRC